ncbi:MAG: M1 family metallopeptidase [Ignavibacteriales bacterium]|nr:M1 family metallopeptidase [Ignavibacteriales bacterium]
MKLKLNHLSFVFAMTFMIEVVTIDAQIIFKNPLSPRIANYNISATLDADKKIIDGKEILRWKNTSPDLITELQFHLYLNAFKNTNSTFIKESGGQLRGISTDVSKEISWGYIDINSIKYVGGNDLTSKMKFIQPDDQNKSDETVVSVSLEKPIKPNEEIALEINFKSKLPKIFARTGFAENYFLVGQWFPKIGVYEYPGIRYAEKGGWNCHQFHANSEFYADFAVYDVNITLPQKFIVGAVGVLQSKINNNDGTATHHYRAEDVVDFAWTASPNFQVVNDQWQNVKIKLMLQPEHFTQVARHINAVKAALEYFDKNLGKYPYTTITIVDPPLKGIGSAGMEYPSFITAGTLWGMPEGIKFPEIVTIHEFGHNYFMGLLASNEFEEAFLDEGFNQYFETRIMNYAYGENTSALNLFGYTAGDFEITRQSYVGLKNPKLAEIFRKSWEYTAGGYGSFTYNKTAVMLKTLEGMVGIETMNEIMKTYYQRWKFKHPCVKDFIAIVNEVVIKNHGRKFGDNMNWYFDQVLYGSDVCDYKLASISNQEIKNVTGLMDQNGKKEFLKRNDENSGNYKSIIVVHRIGEVKLPIEILVHFNNNKESLEKWDGQARSREFKYEGKNKIVWAKIDPFNKIPLDINVVNNSLTTEHESGVFIKYAAKFLFWAQNVMLSFSMLF